MAVLPMSKVSIIGLKKDRKKILEAVQRMGVLEVRAFKGTEMGFENTDTSVSQARFSKACADARQALEFLESYCPEQKSLFASFEGLEGLSVREYEARLEKRDDILSKAGELVKWQKEIADAQGDIIKLSASIEGLTPWKALSVPLNFSGTKRTSAFLGSFPESYSAEELERSFDECCEKKQTEELKNAVHFEIIYESDSQTHIMALCNKEVSEQAESILRYMGLTAPAVSSGVLPTEKIKELEEQIEKSKKLIEENQKKITACESLRDDLKFLVDYFTMRIDKYKVIEKVGQSRNVFVLTGYAPQKDIPKLESELVGKIGVAFEYEDADGDDVPVLLKNNGFAAPLEGVLETFSLPGKGELDPTAAMAVFYYFLFGLMLSDAAYGIIMVLVCAFALWKFPKMKRGLRKSMKMYLYCGISTTFWGVMFGGYFGDAVQVIAKTFFNSDFTIPPLWFSPLDEPMRMLMFSLLVGIVHLFAGLGMKLYALVKAKEYKDAIYDVVFWYLLVGGAIVFLLSMKMFVDMASLSFILPPIAGKIATVAMIIGAIGIALTGGRSSKNPFKRLAKGLYELYNVTGYLSDILSYSRLLALGLATGVIANVFNKMGSMFGGGVLGVIGFILVFVIGHTLNIGINLLGAYVHTNRLQFVEFFGKFYEGGGEKYSPFRADTGYFEIESE
ncbi:MAG: V-type ATP synthase subunit I [Clostridia bacterium]|nr:V-type ATP synthase subunit I [Clostridia bacterium]